MKKINKDVYWWDLIQDMPEQALRENVKRIRSNAIKSIRIWNCELRRRGLKSE